uniref:Uncharacterized protein n=1 Tax=Arundo donax TaxID=35708 RepID=A0A0A9B408_ARUDO
MFEIDSFHFAASTFSSCTCPFTHSSININILYGPSLQNLQMQLSSWSPSESNDLLVQSIIASLAW